MVVNPFQTVLKPHRQRTRLKDVAYSPYLYFLRLYGNTAKALHGFIHRSHVTVWRWMKKHKPQKVSNKRKKIGQFIIDEALLKIGSKFVWLWIAIEPKHRQILKIDMSFERTTLVAERFIASLMDEYDGHPVSTDGDMVSSSLPVPETKASFAFFF